MKELNKLLGIQTKLFTAYHPQTDGQTEQMNQEIEQYFRLFVSHRQDDWPEWIAIVEFSYNDKIHTTMQMSPFFVNYKYHPRMWVNVHNDGNFSLIFNQILEATQKFPLCAKLMGMMGIAECDR